MSLKPTTWGPSYWAQNFGLDDFDSFAEVAAPYAASISVGPIGIPDELVLRTAWYNPTTAQGSYIAVRLRAAGQPIASESTGATLASVIQSAMQSAPGGPMPQLVIPGCYQVSIHATVGGKQVVNVIGVQNAGGSAAGAAAAVKAEWEKVGGPMRIQMAQYLMQKYHAVDIGSTSGAIVDLASTGVGLVSGSLSTRAASALVKWNGGTRNRSSRGRLYFGPLGEGYIDINGATLVPANQTLIQNAFIQFMNGLSTQGYPLVVLSRTLSQAFPVTTVAVEATIATQRRRIRS